MGLIINSTEEKKIIIAGTTIEVPSVYGRIEFAGRADGKTLEIFIATYASKEAYKGGSSILSTDVQQGSLNIKLQGEEKQTIDTALFYSELAYTQMGYQVLIDNI
jgi:hypothetical protein